MIMAQKIKRYSISLLYIILSGSMIQLESCRKHDVKPDKLAEQRKQMAASWTVESVTLSGLDVTAYYKDLILLIKLEGTYECQNAMPPVWPLSGQFELEMNNSELRMIRSDNVDILVQTLDKESMVLQFFWSGEAPSGGRSNSMSGDYVFTFHKP
jgi:hypothetical protein